MNHNDLIKEQFEKQAATFGAMKGHFDALDLIIQMTKAEGKDAVLDVACGPGIVACSFAKKVKEVKGIDLVPAMIERAKEAQAKEGLTNMSWDIANVAHLPYPHFSYSIVVTRFSFHHFIDPLSVLKEMTRVVQRDGRIAVIDVFVTSKEQSQLYDKMEKLRDPSHTRALYLDELTGMFKEADLNIIDRQFYQLEVDVDELLKATLTPEPQSRQVKEMIRSDIKTNKMGINPQIKDEKLVFSFPVVIVVGQKAGESNEP